MNYKVVLYRPYLGTDLIISDSCPREFIPKCIRNYEKKTIGPDKGRIIFNGEADNYSISWKKLVTSLVVNVNGTPTPIQREEMHIKFIPIT